MAEMDVFYYNEIQVGSTELIRSEGGSHSVPDFDPSARVLLFC